MRIALIEVKFSPPIGALDGVPGLRADAGGFVYRIRNADGSLRTCGTHHGTEMEVWDRAIYIAGKAGFTHWTHAATRMRLMPIHEQTGK